MKNSQIAAKVQALLATQTIEQIVEQYRMTDTLIDEIRADVKASGAGWTDQATADYLALTTSRGWMMDALDARGQAGEDALENLLYHP